MGTWLNSTSSEGGRLFFFNLFLFLFKTPFIFTSGCAYLTKITFLIQEQAKPNFSTLESHHPKDHIKGKKFLTFISHKPCTRGSPRL